MPKCGYCNTIIIMRGVKVGRQRFCNQRCHFNARALGAASNVPAEVLNKAVEDAWRGNCPKCGGTGPVDVHKSHQVWSMLVLTRWSSKMEASCRPCARKRQLRGVAFSLFAGWWGFPWGLILTPVQITRNIAGIAGGPNKSKPSDALRKLVMVRIGSKVMANRPHVS
jgi:hypothetical protein